jgi:uncharacterized protein
MMTIRSRGVSDLIMKHNDVQDFGRSVNWSRQGSRKRKERGMDKNEAVALKFIEAMSCNDAAGVAECFAADGVAVTKGFGNFAGKRGAQTVVAAIESFKTLMPGGLKLTVKTVTARGDRVVIEAVGNAETGEGEPYRNEYCFVITLEDHKIKQVNEYLCSKLADEVLWPLAQEMGFV